MLTRTNSRENWRWTWPGVGARSDRGCSQGRRTSLTRGRASHSCQQATATRHVQRSAATGWRGRIVVQPRVCLQKRKACSTVNLRRYQRHSTLRSAGSGPPIQASQSGRGGSFFWGRRSTWTRTRMGRPARRRRGRRSRHRPGLHRRRHAGAVVSAEAGCASQRRPAETAHRADAAVRDQRAARHSDRPRGLAKRTRRSASTVLRASRREGELRDRYRRIAQRKGPKTARVALARHRLTIVYRVLLADGVPYRATAAAACWPQ